MYLFFRGLEDQQITTQAVFAYSLAEIETKEFSIPISTHYSRQVITVVASFCPTMLNSNLGNRSNSNFFKNSCLVSFGCKNLLSLALLSQYFMVRLRFTYCREGSLVLLPCDNRRRNISVPSFTLVAAISPK